MPDLKSLLDLESTRSRVSDDALERTLLRARRRHRRRRVGAGLVGLAACAAVLAALSMGLARTGSRPSASGSPTNRTVALPRCPADASQLRLQPTEPSSSSILIPGNPVAAAFCQYGPAQAARPPRLSRSLDVTGEIRELRSILDRLRPIPRGTIFYCPFDNGSRAILLMAYRDSRLVTIDIHLTGCRLASNGLVRARITLAAQSALARLLGIRFGPS